MVKDNELPEGQFATELNQALEHHKAGRLPQAEAVYRQILQSKPNHPDALHLLGVIAHQVGRYEPAAELIGRAIGFNANVPIYHNNLGEALRGLQKFDAAIAAYRQAIALKPDYAEAHYNMGKALQEQGKLGEAIASFQQAIGLKPDFETHYMLAFALHKHGKLAEAVASYQQAIVLKPNYAGAHNDLGNALQEQGKLIEAIASYQQAILLEPNSPRTFYNLGNALHKQGKLNEVIAAYQQAIACNPDYAEAHYTLGIALNEQGELSGAIASYQRAIGLRPDYARAHNNLGSAFQQQGKLTEAIASYQQAILFKPDYAEAHYNLGIALQQQGMLSEAIASYQQAILFSPDYAEAHMNRALALLLSGKFKDGWPEYEWRLLCKKKKQRSGFLDFPQPKWDGSEFFGKTILIHVEQGIGDTIQFVRYIPLVKAKGGRVLLACQPELRRLLDGFPDIDGLLDKSKISDSEITFDIHVPLLSLPGIFGTNLDTIPNYIPYLRAAPELIKAWSERVEQDSYNVGIVWEGNPEHLDDRNRSCSLRTFALLAQLSGVTLYSLQKGHASEQLAQPPDGMKVIDYSVEFNDFADTAALVANLDLVISVDTAVAHLCGALGHPVWTLIMYSPDWRWFLDRADTPWYPTMRLFRQSTPGDWNPVMEQVEANLRAVSQDRNRPGRDYP